MKKIIAMFVVLIPFVNTSIAQDDKDYSEKFTIGLKAGLNLSNVYDSRGEEFDADPKLGFAGGGFISIPFGKLIGFQPEVLISQKGFMATGQMFGSTYSFTRTTTYLDIPLLFAFKPFEFVTILLGPQYSYLLKQKDVFNSSSITIDQETEFNHDNIRKNTLCITGGADINFNHVVVGLRSGWDLMNNNGDGTSTTPRYKNAWFQATVGYRL